MTVLLAVFMPGLLTSFTWASKASWPPTSTDTPRQALHTSSRELVPGPLKSGKAGASVGISEAIGIYGEVSFMTADDDNNYGVKTGFTVDF